MQEAGDVGKSGDAQLNGVASELDTDGCERAGTGQGAQQFDDDVVGLAEASGKLFKRQSALALVQRCWNSIEEFVSAQHARVFWMGV